MNIRNLLIALLTLVALPFTTFAHAEDTPEDFHIFNEALPPINMNDVDRLEKMGNAWLENKERQPDGKWKLDAFNNAFRMYLGDAQNGQFDFLEKLFDKWRAAYPASKIEPVVRAYMLFNYAYSFRGTTYANEVWDEDWKPFEANLKKAYDVLQKSKASAGGNPRWYSTMVSVKANLGLPKSELLATGREGLSKNPSHTVTAENTLLFMLPRWGGSVKAVRDWIEEAAAITKATEGDSYFARLYWELLPYNESAQFFGPKFNRDRLSKATDDLLERFPTMHHFVKAAHISCQFHDPVEVKKRYEAAAKRDGPKSPPTVDPAIYCDWPETVARDPGIITPDKMPDQTAPRKTSTH